MITLILLSTLIIVVLYLLNKEISTAEFLAMVVVVIFIIWLPFGLYSLPTMNDINYESGKLIQTQFNPEFIEQYSQPHTVCTSTGKSTVCHTYYTTEYAKHKEYWTVSDSLGQKFKVTKKFHEEVKKEFGNHKIVKKPNKCKHGGKVYKGDPHVYVYDNETKSYQYPTNKISSWHNPIKNRISLFNSKSTIKKNYPMPESYLVSNRLMLPGEGLTRRDWDELNTRIYEKVGANVILLKVKDSEEANQIEDLWLQGKKNDIIICIKGKYNNPDFVKVFGWSETAYVKIKLQNSILENGIDLVNIENIITNYYKPYDMKQFNYITSPPPIWISIISIILTIIVLIFMYAEFTNNFDSKY